MSASVLLHRKGSQLSQLLMRSPKGQEHYLLVHLHLSDEKPEDLEKLPTLFKVQRRYTQGLQKSTLRMDSNGLGDLHGSLVHGHLEIVWHWANH